MSDRGIEDKFRGLADGILPAGQTRRDHRPVLARRHAGRRGRHRPQGGKGLTGNLPSTAHYT